MALAKVFVYFIDPRIYRNKTYITGKNCFAVGINDNVTYHQLKNLFIFRKSKHIHQLSIFSFKMYFVLFRCVMVWVSTYPNTTKYSLFTFT